MNETHGQGNVTGPGEEKPHAGEAEPVDVTAPDEELGLVVKAFGQMIASIDVAEDVEPATVFRTKKGEIG